MTLLSKKQQLIRNLAILALLFLTFLLWSILGPWALTEHALKYLLFSLGYLIGTTLMIGDEKLFYRWYSDSEKFLVTRSPLFILCLPFISIFVLTSTGSIIGMAMMLAINSFLCLESWLLLSDSNSLNQHFNLELKENLPSQKILLLRASIIAYFLFLFISFF